MNRNSWTMGLALGFVLALGTGGAEAGEIPLKGSISGTFVNIQTDTNGDGFKASLNSLGAKGTLGSSTMQGVTELVFSGFAICPNGNAGVEFTLLRPSLPAAPAQFVQRFDSTGDLLFYEQVSATLCFDPITQNQFFSATGIITDGTGRFAGAKGSFTNSGTAKMLFEDAATGHFFGEQSGTFEATIITP